MFLMALRSPYDSRDLYYDINGLHSMPVVKSAYERAREGRVRSRWPRFNSSTPITIYEIRYEGPFFVRR
jgi:hypothetical protein